MKEGIMVVFILQQKMMKSWLQRCGVFYTMVRDERKRENGDIRALAIVELSYAGLDWAEHRISLGAFECFCFLIWWAYVFVTLEQGQK